MVRAVAGLHVPHARRPGAVEGSIDEGAKAWAAPAQASTPRARVEALELSPRRGKPGMNMVIGSSDRDGGCPRELWNLLEKKLFVLWSHQDFTQYLRFLIFHFKPQTHIDESGIVASGDIWGRDFVGMNRLL